ncbi:MAG: lipoprotein insertase outer membrane protein LolB [Sulfuricaulis sp.]|uniref:lipoprotein insertase outer membrane protein LolB n=1 Tax=Sulfuricaulis sp. TaxID=2003553 RepID=UPI003C4D71A5
MRYAAGLLGLTALAAGCATAPALPPVENPAATWQARQTELRPITTWKIQGRMSMRTAEEGWQASLSWVREGDRHRIDIIGPLGRGHLRLTRDNQGAELRDADQHSWHAENPEQLLYQTTGWLLPLDGLNYWVLGLPLPDSAASQELDPQGRLKTLSQSGWDIRFLEYARYGALDLPSKLFIKRQGRGMNGSPANDATLEVRLVIERWALSK